MIRYFAAMWDPHNPSERQFAALVKSRLHDTAMFSQSEIDRPGLFVCVTGVGPTTGSLVRLPGNCGVIIGTLFSSRLSPDEHPQPISTCSPEEAAPIIDSRGRSLVRSHWGSYVLFLQLPREAAVLVLRGPMGTIPCFQAEYNDVRLCFSSIEDCLSLQLTSFSLNWDCIRAQAAGGDYWAHETAIEGISTSIAGECLEYRPGHEVKRTVYWDPSRLHPVPSLTAIGEAAALLRDATQACVDAWASPHRTLLLQFSGGFDSSVLQACLKRAPNRPEIISVNFWSTASGDERRFARSMTKLTCTELIELERNQNVDLRLFMQCARTGNPVLNFSAVDAEPRLIRIAHERGASAVFSGEIGDNIFGHCQGPEMLGECLRSFRPGLGLIRATTDYAELSRISLWSALKQGYLYSKWQGRQNFWSVYRYRRFVGITEHKSLVADDARLKYEEMLDRFIHPWLSDVRDMPLGRTMLIFALVAATSTLTHSPFAGPDSSLFLSPLASQPLVDVYCQIPCHLHFLGAENGTVGREAFRPLLSEQVLMRGTGKGTPDLWWKDVISRNQRFLRELLLDGLLVREGILDRSKLEAVLSQGVSKSQIAAPELVIQIYIECWVRRWLSGTERAAA